MNAQEARDITRAALLEKEVEKEAHRQKRPHPLLDEFVALCVKEVRKVSCDGHNAAYILTRGTPYEDLELEIQAERLLKEQGFNIYRTTMSWGREFQIVWR